MEDNDFDDTITLEPELESEPIDGTEKDGVRFDFVTIEGAFEGGVFPDDYALIIKRVPNMSKQSLVDAVQKKVKEIIGRYPETEHKAQIQHFTQWLSRCLNIDSAIFYSKKALEDELSMSEKNLSEVMDGEAWVDPDIFSETTFGNTAE